jgi:hypothetical protein
MKKVTNLLFVRGLIGSGKSFLANNLAKQLKCEVIERSDFEDFEERLNAILSKIERGDSHIVLVDNIAGTTLGHIASNLPDRIFNCQYYLADGNHMEKIGYSRDVTYLRRERRKLRWRSNPDYVERMVKEFPKFQHHDCYKGDGILK